MTTALPASSARRSPNPRLHLVGERPAAAPAEGAAAARVAYLVFLPADVDPVALMRAHGVRPELRTLEPGRSAASDSPSAPRFEAVRSGGGIRIDRARRLVSVDGRELDLTYMEFSLLDHLASRPHTVHTRDALISGVWGYGHIGDGRTVDVHVARLRRKLGPAHRGRIATVRRVGYTYVPEPR
ncbi:winged helix-turn-helix domain-containing protein [Streptomyces subrutilus]|uniref:winged helix-turn-helix domain-containing protein n=1 Tax=Streptomyces subrutilus TaxID=36818 RepID=UPI0033D408D1